MGKLIGVLAGDSPGCPKLLSQAKDALFRNKNQDDVHATALLDFHTPRVGAATHEG